MKLFNAACVAKAAWKPPLDIFLPCFLKIKAPPRSIGSLTSSTRPSPLNSLSTDPFHPYAAYVNDLSLDLALLFVQRGSCMYRKDGSGWKSSFANSLRSFYCLSEPPLACRGHCWVLPPGSPALSQQWPPSVCSMRNLPVNSSPQHLEGRFLEGSARVIPQRFLCPAVNHAVSAKSGPLPGWQRALHRVLFLSPREGGCPDNCIPIVFRVLST